MINDASRVTPSAGLCPQKELLTVRTLSLQEIDMATKLFERDPNWGGFYGEKFRVEVAHAIKLPPSTLHGSFSSEGRLIAVGAVFKEPFDYAYWSLSWIFVDVDARGRGFGRQIVGSLIAHARSEQLKSHNPNCRVLLSTSSSVAAFYEKGWGFRAIHSGPLSGESLMSLDVEGPGLPMRNR